MPKIYQSKESLIAGGVKVKGMKPKRKKQWKALKFRRGGTMNGKVTITKGNEI